MLDYQELTATLVDIVGGALDKTWVQWQLQGSIGADGTGLRHLAALYICEDDTRKLLFATLGPEPQAQDLANLKNTIMRLKQRADMIAKQEALQETWAKLPREEQTNYIQQLGHRYAGEGVPIGFLAFYQRGNKRGVRVFHPCSIPTQGILNLLKETVRLETTQEDRRVKAAFN